MRHHYEHSLEHPLDEGVTEAECGGGEGIDDGGVDLAVVLVAVPKQARQDVQFRHVSRPQHDRQPLVVGDVLQPK